MTRYKNKGLLKKLGSRIKSEREKRRLEIKDVSYLTGFTDLTIKNIENGEETTISYFVEICKAMAIHPRDVFDLEISMQPRYILSPNRVEKTRLTSRIMHYIDKGYFIEERSAKDVLDQLFQDYKINTTTSAISVILKRLAEDGFLILKKRKARNFYKK